MATQKQVTPREYRWQVTPREYRCQETGTETLLVEPRDGDVRKCHLELRSTHRAYNDMGVVLDKRAVRSLIKTLERYL